MKVDSRRILKRIEEIYSVGLKSDGTHERIAYSEEDQAGKKLFSKWAVSKGLKVKTDSAGNLIISMDGKRKELPSIVMGSHLDTVPDGGRFDGVLGCIGGLEVLEVLTDNGIKPEHTLEVIVFSDEEGMRFGKGLLGSSAIAGLSSGLKAEDIDKDGNSARDVLQNAGIDFEKIGLAKRKREEICGFFELHVEQGSVLYKENKKAGIVSSIAGVSRYRAISEGEANHSGSTMMSDRKDALVSAAKIIASIPELVSEYGNEYTVATVGDLKIFPGSVNVIPEKCEFLLEIRDQEEGTIKEIEKRITENSKAISCKNKTQISFENISYHKPVEMDKELKNIIRETMKELGTDFKELPSGAFHDSLLMAEKFPTAMIFVPSVNGISHSPKEYTEEEDIAAGCQILLHTVIKADKIL